MTTKSADALKLDLKRSLGALYSPRGTACALVTPPLFQVLAIEGSGNPNTSQAWRDAMEALYSTAYTLKFMLKKAAATPDFSVMPLEALWWVGEGELFSQEFKENWLWRAYIVQPDFVTQAHVSEALALARAKKNSEALNNVALLQFNEGPSAQVLHIGPYADEAPTIARLNEFIHAHGFVQAGKHHEIYLSDPGRVAPEKMKTIVRLPVGKVESHV